MGSQWRIWSRDDDHVLASLGSFCLIAYARPYTVPDAELFLQVNEHLRKSFPLASSLSVVDTSKWGIPELRMLRCEDTRARLAQLRSDLPDTSTTSIVCVGTGLAAAFTKSLAYGFAFVSRSRRAGMFTDIPAGIGWLHEYAQVQQGYPGHDQIRHMLNALDHRALRY